MEQKQRQRYLEFVNIIFLTGWWGCSRSQGSQSAALPSPASRGDLVTEPQPLLLLNR